MNRYKVMQGFRVQLSFFLSLVGRGGGKGANSLDSHEHVPIECICNDHLSRALCGLLLVWRVSSVSDGPCKSALMEALEQDAAWAGSYLPQCDDAGFFLPKQCWPFVHM